MTTISCEVLRGGGYAPRLTLNGQTFIECGVMRGGAAAGSKIGSTANIIVVDSWDPAFNTQNVDHGHSIKVNLHAENTEEKEVLYDEGADFLTTGVFDDTEVVIDALNLVTSPSGDDFEGYTIGQNPLGNGWTARTTDTSWSIQQELSGESQHARAYGNNDESVMVLDSAGDSTDVIVEARIQFPESSDSPQAGVTARITGAGTAMRGYCAYITRTSSWLFLKRFTGDGTMFGVLSIPITAVVENQWYRIKLRCIGSSISAKVWKEGDGEPGYSGTTNTSHPGPGASGVWYRSPSATRRAFYDDVLVETVPPTYASSGSWEDDIDVSSVDHYSHGLISWDETTPTDTTAVVKARWRDIDSWTACTSGGELPGMDLGDDMRVGATKDTLSLRVELTTTDSQATAAVENIRIYFEPVANDGLLIDLAGDIDHVVADATLDVWGKKQVSGGTPFTAWDDVWLQTDGPRWVYSPGQEISVYLEYGGVAIDDIVIGLAWDLWMETSDLTGIVWGLTPLVYEAAPISVRWICRSPWTPGGHVYEWVLIDKGIGIHADAWWICGHYQLDRHPGMLIAAVAERTNYPGSLLVKGWKLNDHLGQLLVQGYRLDRSPGMIMVAERYHVGTPGSILVGAQHMTSVPGMILVYGVNRDGAVFVNAIDNATYQALLDEGITFS